MSENPGAQVRVLWIPVGAGSRIVPHTSRWWELYRARREKRAPLPLVHAALEVEMRGQCHVIEMAPVLSGPPGHSRHAVFSAPVGSRLIGWLPAFRYEVRCWSGGVIPDRDQAVLVTAFSVAEPQADALLAEVASAPRFTWGRSPAASSDMWNSNSLISWLLARIEVPGDVVVTVPVGYRAPGWQAGLDSVPVNVGR